jgi:uncharacterized damage-inducible protein DinB
VPDPAAGSPAASERAAALARDLESASEAVVALLENVPSERWMHVPDAGVWSVGKDAEHLAEAAAYHQWIVRLTIGQHVASRRPQLERNELTTYLSPRDAVDLLLRRTVEGATLIRALTDEQLDLPTRPPRASAQTLAVTIERVLVGHYRTHLDDIAAKLRGPAG